MRHNSNTYRVEDQLARVSGQLADAEKGLGEIADIRMSVSELFAQNERLMHELQDTFHEGNLHYYFGETVQIVSGVQKNMMQELEEETEQLTVQRFRLSEEEAELQMTRAGLADEEG